MLPVRVDQLNGPVQRPGQALRGVFPNNPDLELLYHSIVNDIVETFRGQPGITVIHRLMAERLAYIYTRSIEVAREGTEASHVERSFLDAFNRTVAELGKETRTLSREGSFREALVRAVIGVLQEELDSYPDLTQRVTQRLEAL